MKMAECASTLDNYAKVFSHPRKIELATAEIVETRATEVPTSSTALLRMISQKFPPIPPGRALASATVRTNLSALPTKLVKILENSEKSGAISQIDVAIACKSCATRLPGNYETR